MLRSMRGGGRAEVARRAAGKWRCIRGAGTRGLRRILGACRVASVKSGAGVARHVAGKLRNIREFWGRGRCAGLWGILRGLRGGGHGSSAARRGKVRSMREEWCGCSAARRGQVAQHSWVLGRGSCAGSVGYVAQHAWGVARKQRGALRASRAAFVGFGARVLRRKCGGRCAACVEGGRGIARRAAGKLRSVRGFWRRGSCAASWGRVAQHTRGGAPLFPWGAA